MEKHERPHQRLKGLRNVEEPMAEQDPFEKNDVEAKDVLPINWSQGQLEVLDLWLVQHMPLEKSPLQPKNHPIEIWKNHLNQSSIFGFQLSIFQSVISNFGEAALGWLGWKKHGVETGLALKFHYVRRAKNLETLPNVSRNHRISMTLLIPNLAALGSRLEPSGLQDIQPPTKNKQNCWSELLWKCTHLQAMVNW